jgi:chromosome partitioning protein
MTTGENMKVIAIICQKGGVGKTSLSVHLATAAVLAGHQAAVIDLDPQATATSWGDRRQDAPEVISCQAGRLAANIENARANGADLLVIDTPPQADSIAHAAVKAADLVLVPIRPAMWDLQAAEPSLLLPKLASKPAFVVLNGVRPNSNVGLEAIAFLEAQGAQIAPVSLQQRVHFEYAIRDGRTVQETYPGEIASNEVWELYVWVCGHVGMPTRGQVAA